jgi:serine/threonine-protein kinase
MNNDRWRSAESIFAQATQLAPARRQAHVEQACGDDQELRLLVEMMLDGTARPAAVGAEPLDELEPTAELGARFGPYRITGVVACRSADTVYRAVRDDDPAHPEVRVRIPRGDASDNPLHSDRLRQLRRTLAALPSSNLARLLDGGDKPQPFVVWESLRGAPLLEHCAGRSIDERLRLFLGVCDAVRQLHTNLVVHQAIEAAEIVVDPGGRAPGVQAMLTHVGIGGPPPDVAAMDRLARLNPNCASPEQVRGGAITTATDVYALGAVLYELLTGRTPHQFGSAAPADVERVICEVEATPPSRVAPEELRATLEGDLDAIVLTSLRKDASRRYRSAEALAADIRAYLGGLPVSCRPNAAVYRAGRYFKRHRIAAFAAAAAVVGLGLGVVLALQQARAARESFRDTRQLAMRFLLEFDQSIRDTPGNAKARDLVARTSIDYLERLRAIAGRDPELIREVATVYSRVAEAQGASETATALDTHTKAAGLWKQILESNRNDPDAMEHLAELRFREGDLLDRAGDKQRSAAAYEEGFRAAQGAATIDPKRSRPMFLTAMGWSNRAEEHRAANRPKEALEASEKAIEAYRRVVELEATDRNRSGLAIALDRAGMASLDLHDPSAASKFFKQGTEIRMDLLARNPNSIAYRRGFAVHLVNTASALCSPHTVSLGDCKQAGEQLRRAADQFEPLIERDPNDPATLGDSLHALSNLCVTMAEARAPGAGSTCKQAIERASRLRNLRDRADYSWWQGMAFAGLARAEMTDWHLVASQAAAQVAVSILRDRKFRPEQVRVDLIRAETALGEAFLAQGRRLQAREAFHRAKDAMASHKDLATLRASAVPLRRLAEMGADIEERCDWLRQEVRVWEQWREGGGPNAPVPKLPSVCGSR